MLLFRSAYTELTLITLLVLMKELGRKSADKHTHTHSFTSVREHVQQVTAGRELEKCERF